MKIQDDRTQEQKLTHNYLIVGTDTFLSGWGKATGGASYAAWACEPDDWCKVEKWVKNRSDMKRVRVIIETKTNSYRPNAKGHLHIYVVDKNHPALN